MKKLLLSMMLLTSLSTSLFADKAALVERMLELANISKLMDPVLTQMQAQLDRQFQAQATTPAKKAIVKKYSDQIVQTTKEALAWENIKQPFIKLYMKVYTEDELEELIKFYSSPVGKKMMQKMPELLTKSMALSQEIMKPVVPKIQSLAIKMSKELQSAQ